uniref:Ig-like domain-containing protein n=1 Tax=Anopheles maculatus TaxID=74869 RepID=A0A182SBB4_9DIPT
MKKKQRQVENEFLAAPPSAPLTKHSNQSNNRCVSWIRRQDFQLLTVGLSTYSSDERFLVEHLRHLGHWALRIKSVRTEDEGLYECQLSVHPVQSVFVELKVVGKHGHVYSPIFHHHCDCFRLQLFFVFFLASCVLFVPGTSSFL